MNTLKENCSSDDFTFGDIAGPTALETAVSSGTAASNKFNFTSVPAKKTGFSKVPTRLNNIAQATFTRLMSGATATRQQQKRSSLPVGYFPGDLDVCCGRGKRNWNHGGNVWFRNVIRNSVARYITAPTKNDKTLVVVSIVDEIRLQGGRFLKEDTKGRWYDIGDAQARDKVGHSLRDQVTAISREKRKKEAMPNHTTSSNGNGNGGNGTTTATKAPNDQNAIENNIHHIVAKNIAKVNDQLEQERQKASAETIETIQKIETDSNPYEYGPQQSFRGLPFGGRHNQFLMPEQKAVMERRPSVQSDSGLPELSCDLSLRRSSKENRNSGTTQVLNSFSRRPSFLAFSFNSREGSHARASVLMGGDPQAVKDLEMVRRSTNWEWLESLDDLLDMNNYEENGVVIEEETTENSEFNKSERTTGGLDASLRRLKFHEIQKQESNDKMELPPAQVINLHQPISMIGPDGIRMSLEPNEVTIPTTSNHNRINSNINNNDIDNHGMDLEPMSFPPEQIVVTGGIRTSLLRKDNAYFPPLRLEEGQAVRAAAAFAGVQRTDKVDAALADSGNTGNTSTDATDGIRISGLSVMSSPGNMTRESVRMTNLMRESLQTIDDPRGSGKTNVTNITHFASI